VNPGASLRVVLDARPLQSGSGRRGIGRYVRELARHLPGTDGVERVYLLLDSTRAPALELPEGPGVVPLPVARPPGPAVLTDRLRAIPGLRGLGARVFHATYLPPPRLSAPMATVMTVHDLTPLQFPGSVPWKAGLVFRWTYARARTCRLVLVPSRATARALRERLGIPAERIRVTHLGVDARRFGDDAPAESAFAGRYLLHVGGFDGTKNLEILLDVLERLDDEETRDVRLIVVGDGGEAARRFAESSRRRGLEPRVELPGRLDDAGLGSAYAGAQIFVFPSRAEGFGLPALEAQAAGCPVLAADAASLPEVLGDAGRLLPVDDPEAWAREIRELLQRPEERRSLGEAGRRRARAFTWSATAAATVAAYREAIDS
jgi:glycosyltransferase involved in cell wall biosynthesis